MSRFTTSYFPLSSSFIGLTLFPLWRFIFLLSVSVSSFKFYPFTLTLNRTHFFLSWLTWKMVTLPQTHWDQIMGQGKWSSPRWMLGYFGAYVQDECVGIYSVLCLGNRQCPTLGRNITHVWWCPTLQAPSVPWIPLLWVDIWARVGILLSNSFNTHTHLSAAKMCAQEINENMRIVLYLSYIIADFLRSLFKRPEDVNQIDNVFLWGKVSKTSAFIIVC